MNYKRYIKETEKSIHIKGKQDFADSKTSLKVIAALPSTALKAFSRYKFIKSKTEKRKRVNGTSSLMLSPYIAKNHVKESQRKTSFNHSPRQSCKSNKLESASNFEKKCKIGWTSMYHNKLPWGQLSDRILSSCNQWSGRGGKIVTMNASAKRFWCSLAVRDRLIYWLIAATYILRVVKKGNSHTIDGLILKTPCRLFAKAGIYHRSFCGSTIVTSDWYTAFLKMTVLVRSCRNRFWKYDTNSLPRYVLIYKSSRLGLPDLHETVGCTWHAYEITRHKHVASLAKKLSTWKIFECNVDVYLVRLNTKSLARWKKIFVFIPIVSHYIAASQTKPDDVTSLFV